MPIPKWKIKGIVDDITECGCCGRRGLKRTVAMMPLDADGNEDGAAEDVVFYGTSCAADALSWTQGKVTDTARAAQAERDQRDNWARRMLSMRAAEDEGRLLTLFRSEYEGLTRPAAAPEAGSARTSWSGSGRAAATSTSGTWRRPRRPARTGRHPRAAPRGRRRDLRQRQRHLRRQPTGSSRPGPQGSARDQRPHPPRAHPAVGRRVRAGVACHQAAPALGQPGRCSRGGLQGSPIGQPVSPCWLSA